MSTKRLSTLLALAAVAACGEKATVAAEDSANDASVGDDMDVLSDDDGADGDSTMSGDDDLGGGPASDDDAILVEPEAAPPLDGGREPVLIQFDGGEAGVESCGGEAVQASQRDVSLLLVFDKSGSMLFAGPDGVDRWTQLTQATAATLETIAPNMSLGLALFPHRTPEPLTDQCTDDGSCCAMPEGEDAIVVPIQEGTRAATRILNELSGTTPAGATPTAEALRLAHQYLVEGSGAEAPGDRYVLLVTDGGPMCNADLSCEAETCVTNIDGNCPEVVGNCCDAAFEQNYQCLDVDAPREQIEALASAGVRTAVVGIPGTASYAEQLNAFARAGGLENPNGDTSYYAVSEDGGSEALQTALSDITRQLVHACELQLGEVPPDPDKVNVRIEGELVPQQGDDGWTLTVVDGVATVTLQGATCARVEEQGVESIAVLFGCPTVLRPPGAR